MAAVSWPGGRGRRTPALLVALFAALPAASARSETATAAAVPVRQAATAWPIPVVRFGGQVSYSARRELDALDSSTLHGAAGLLNAGADTYLWEPWFAQLGATVGVSAFSQAGSSRASGGPGAVDSRSTFMTGDARLRLVPASSFPFELHYHRSDSRSESRPSLDSVLRASRVGFTQRLSRYGGDAMIGWDRSIQHGITGASARQETAQLNLTQPVGHHVLRMSGTSSRNRRGTEWANDGSLSLLHDFQQADTGLSVSNLVHLTRTAHRIGAAGSRSDMRQLSSQALWRPDDSDLAAVLGVRLLGFEAGSGDGAPWARLRNANLNGGASYDLTPEIRLDGSANLNYNNTGREGSHSTQQSARASYLPDPISTGRLRYGWNAAASASHNSGVSNGAGGVQLTLQAGHNVVHTAQLGRSTVTVDGAQSLSWRETSDSGPGQARHLNHSASVAWSLLDGDGLSTSASIGASDTRELGGSGEFYQLLNFQLTSNLASGRYGALSGNLTLQAVRQRGAIATGDGSDPLQALTRAGDGEVSTVSSGTLSYSNERWLGVPRLRLVSSLRLNSRALMPLLGTEAEQHSAAWESQLDYRIGLVSVRVAYLVVRTAAGADSSRAPLAAGEQATRRAAQFWLSRSFGHL